MDLSMKFSFEQGPKVGSCGPGGGRVVCVMLVKDSRDLACMGAGLRLCILALSKTYGYSS